MMSLVAYGASSDEDSEHENEEQTKGSTGASAGTKGYISDDGETFVPEAVSTLDGVLKTISLSLLLPKPKNTEIATLKIFNEMEENDTPTFSKLPLPKCSAITKETVEEKDDEFLHKKEIPLEREKPPPPLMKNRVKIAIPSLKDFNDVERELKNKSKEKAATPIKTKGTSLLNILPTAKSEQDYSKAAASKIQAPAFIPDCVKSRRPAHNIEEFNIRAVPKKKIANSEKVNLSAVDSTDTDTSDDEPTAKDFFALETDEAETIPQISTNEINAMVAKRAIKMAETSNKFMNSTAEKDTNDEERVHDADEFIHTQKRSLDADAMRALVGSSKKRRHKQGHDIQVMDISSDQVLPNREEWMRTALASSTGYQPTGQLADDEPVTGTRRKHQITYLAHKAKANEAELQAIWATNRQTRRINQSKYGF